MKSGVWHKRKTSLKNVLGTRGEENKWRETEERKEEKKEGEWKEGVRGVGRGLIPRRLR